MTNQERNREALIQHVADLEAIIRRRNEQIAAQAETIEEVRRDLDDYQAMHSRQIETIARLQENPRPLTADDEMLSRAVLEARKHENTRAAFHSEIQAILTAALTPPPARPEGAEEIQSLIRDAENEGQGADNEALADYLAARLTDPTAKEQS